MRIKPQHAAVVFLLLILPAAVFIPVRQAAQNRELAFEIAQLENEIQELDEQIRQLNAQIAELESPDRISRLIEFYADVRKAEEQDILIVTDKSGESGEQVE
jgi:cell division protein FtsL